MAQDKIILTKEWESLPKNWYAIYQWNPASRSGYTEFVADLILAGFPDIRLITDGLRQRSFRVSDHKGQIKLQTGIEQLTEKRLVRAMFNRSEIPLLGKVIDYEVPLKETDDADHGDIDLLCVQSETAFCVEAKKPGSSESLLKPVLQAFVYTSLVCTRKMAFLGDFGLPATQKLTPTVLTFASALSGRQLKKKESFPNLWRLIATLNTALAEREIGPLRFFVVENDIAELKTCLSTSGDKAVFRDGFTPTIVEHGSECIRQTN